VRVTVSAVVLWRAAGVPVTLRWRVGVPVTLRWRVGVPVAPRWRVGVPVAPWTGSPDRGAGAPVPGAPVLLVRGLAARAAYVPDRGVGALGGAVAAVREEGRVSGAGAPCPRRCTDAAGCCWRLCCSTGSSWPA
jgi:hypothetical protein